MNRAEELRERIKRLPVGNITVKTIRGQKRMYLQWREDGKNRSRYIRKKDEAEIRAAIAERDALEEELQGELTGVNRRILREEIPMNGFLYATNVKTGSELIRAREGVRQYRERECMGILRNYLHSETTGKVCLVYGLRRTGKTTMLFQAMGDLDPDKTAYIKIMGSNTMAELNADLRILSKQGREYVFIDEITLMKDFIDSASLLSDVYAMFGMKIVLSGTDSLGFVLSADEELYDRTVTIHTTFIPFREYSRLLGIKDVDEYIRYGGTFRVGETSFEDPEWQDEGVSFRDDESTRRYIDTAIARNIQHSLACYRDGDHFRHLQDLYERNELTGAIQRIVEDMNHRFLVSVLTRDFKCDIAGVTERLMKILEIRNRKDQSVEIGEDHVKEIREYLRMLDLTVPCPVESIGTEKGPVNELFSQPGMRFCQAQTLVFTLMKDEELRKYPIEVRKEIENLILDDVRGRMLEEIVLLETLKTAKPGQRVFKLQFAAGEYDMVILHEREMTCELFEVKHTDRIAMGQIRHLSDPEKIRAVEHEYGKVIGKTVLYRGKDRQVGEIRYRNVEEFLAGGLR